MRPIGFSTGALALSDFRHAMDLLRDKAVSAIELSALRFRELNPMLEVLSECDLSKYKFKGFHAPSSFDRCDEAYIVQQLHRYVPRDWPIVLHPDAIYDFSLWSSFGDQLTIENMDRRKPIGRTAAELSTIFKQLPDASLCFDIGHARQVDTTMTEGYNILKQHRRRLTWLHVSEVNSQSRHEPLSFASINAFSEISYLIPDDVPVILEARTSAEAIDTELRNAQCALPKAVSSLISA